MKTNLIIYSLLVLVLTSFKGPQKIIGSWDIIKIEMNDGFEMENVNKWISFCENGELKGGKQGEEVNNFGKWNYDENKKSVSILFETNDGGNGNFEIKKLTNKKLVLFQEAIKIYLEKSDLKHCKNTL